MYSPSLAFNFLPDILGVMADVRHLRPVAGGEAAAFQFTTLPQIAGDFITHCATRDVVHQSLYGPLPFEGLKLWQRVDTYGLLVMMRLSNPIQRRLAEIAVDPHFGLTIGRIEHPTPDSGLSTKVRFIGPNDVDEATALFCAARNAYTLRRPSPGVRTVATGNWMYSQTAGRLADWVKLRLDERDTFGEPSS